MPGSVDDSRVPADGVSVVEGVGDGLRGALLDRDDAAVGSRGGLSLLLNSHLLGNSLDSGRGQGKWGEDVLALSTGDKVTHGVMAACGLVEHRGLAIVHDRVDDVGRGSVGDNGALVVEWLGFALLDGDDLGGGSGGFEAVLENGRLY